MKGFADRRHAGRVLGDLLGDHRGALVLGIPRGGVVVAAIVAEAIDGELDVAVARKLGAPGNPELAIGAVGVDGLALLDKGIVAVLGVSGDQIEAEVARQTVEAQRRVATYRGERPAPRLADRTVVVVDDGVATGATMKAVLAETRRQRPATLICAIPCGPPSTVQELAALADEVVCPLMPAGFMAVGQWYRDFTQVTDDEVLALLAGAGQGA